MQWAVPTPSSRSPRLSFRYSFQVVLGFFALLPSVPLSLSVPLLFRLSSFRPSTLSSFFPAGLSGYFPFPSLPLPLSVLLLFGFRFFRIFSNPENDTDETLTTSGVSRGDFCQTLLESQRTESKFSIDLG